MLKALPALFTAHAGQPGAVFFTAKCLFITYLHCIKFKAQTAERKRVVSFLYLQNLGVTGYIVTAEHFGSAEGFSEVFRTSSLEVINA